MKLIGTDIEGVRLTIFICVRLELAVIVARRLQILQCRKCALVGFALLSGDWFGVV